MIAEFAPGKRHEDAINAIAELGSEVHLLLAGSGARMEAMQDLAAAFGCSERVHFLGLRDDITELIRMSDVVLLTSEREGLPRSILESMSLEVPVVASDIRDNRDLLESGAGLLVPLGDVDEYVQAIKTLLADAETAAAMGRLDRQRVLERHDIARVLAAYEEIYDRTLSMGHADG